MKSRLSYFGCWALVGLLIPSVLAALIFASPTRAPLTARDFCNYHTMEALALSRCDKEPGCSLTSEEERDLDHHYKQSVMQCERAAFLKAIEPEEEETPEPDADPTPEGDEYWEYPEDKIWPDLYPDAERWDDNYYWGMQDDV